MALSFLSDIGLIAWNDEVSFTTVMQRNTKKVPRQFKNWNPDMTKKLNLYLDPVCVDTISIKLFNTILDRGQTEYTEYPDALILGCA